MMEKVVLRQEEQLPVPRISLTSPEDLAQWYISQLTWTLEQGQKNLSISCFHTASMGFSVSLAASSVLKAVTDFLYDHPEIESLTILCDGAETYRAYSLHWNIWYAPYKPDHDHSHSL